MPFDPTVAFAVPVAFDPLVAFKAAQAQLISAHSACHAGIWTSWYLFKSLFHCFSRASFTTFFSPAFLFLSSAARHLSTFDVSVSATF